MNDPYKACPVCGGTNTVPMHFMKLACQDCREVHSVMDRTLSKEQKERFDASVRMNLEALPENQITNTDCE